MNERIDEVKGSIKEGVGKLTGNREMEAEGRGQREVARGQREVKGAANKVKGKVEQTVGRLTDDESMRAQGTVDELRGDSQRTG